jgi:mannose/cellobiose epimerase-like protein (N-acyl-D-glucosamine 2-epimerase family)
MSEPNTRTAGADADSLVALVERVGAWTFDQALPFWADAGRDGRELGFVERLDRSGRPDGVDFKRIRVQARQIYVFSHAHLLGWRGGLAAAEAGYQFLRAHGRLDGGGWAKVLSRNGAVVDPTFDLYDQAFILFALAWYHRTTGDAESLVLAADTIAAIDGRLARADRRGLRSADPDTNPGGLQNPHMHLLEAMLALYDATGDESWRHRASKLGDLFTATLFDPQSGTLAEAFDADWRRVDPVVIEPGHHFEWTWLLHRLGEATGRDFSRQSEALFAFADRFGVDPEMGLVCDALSDRGVVTAGARRLWPQTERLKALLARGEASGAFDDAALRTTLANILHRYLAPAPQGCWRDRLDESGRVIDEPIPASTLYHLFLAFSELLRLETRIGTAA